MMGVKRVTIIGLGLIGGSLGLALKNACGDKLLITGVDYDQTVLRQALERHAVDFETADLTTGVREADIIFLCTPVLQIVPVVQQLLPYVKSGVILSDVGSTKQAIAEKLANILPEDVYYVSGHPMAGREQSGIMAASKDLFRGKCYIIAPEVSTSPEAVEIICRLLRWTGAEITTMNVASHDRCAAVISHIPHVVAAALVNLLDHDPDPEGSLKLAGGGFRDTTRIASSNADMWADICLTNVDAIVDGLANLQAMLSGVAEAAQQGNRPLLYEFFRAAKVRRDALLSASLSPSGNL